MNQLKFNGMQKFMGIDIPVVEGGFGENQKVILAKTVAEIHGVRMNDVQDLIQQNIDEFEFGVDLLDLCDENFKTDAVGLGFITSNRQKNCYLLPEQGYMLLVGFMKTPKAKEIRKDLRREYFAIREAIKSSEQLKAQLLLSIYDGGQSAILASKQLSELEVKEAVAPLIAENTEMKPKAEFFDAVADSKTAISMNEVAKVLAIRGYGRNNLFEFLRKESILDKYNVPYQKYVDCGWFRVIEQKYMKNGEPQITTKTLVYQKGVDGIRKRVLEYGEKN